MSKQLLSYLALRADGVSVLSASFKSGIPIGEAHLYEKDIASGELKLPIPAAGNAASTQGGPDMAKGNQQTSIEVKKPDFERAVKIFRQDIKPANEKGGEHAQAASTGYKAIKKECRVNTRAAKFVFQLSGESEEKRDDVLRSLRGLLLAMNIGISADLVSDAEGEDTTAPIIPTVKPEQTGLATVQ